MEINICTRGFVNGIFDSILAELCVRHKKNFQQKSELAVKADHVLKFCFDPELNHVQGRVEASMRDRSYHVNVSARLSESFLLK